MVNAEFLITKLTLKVHIYTKCKSHRTHFKLRDTSTNYAISYFNVMKTKSNE